MKKNRQILLASRPVGIPGPEHFRVGTTDARPPDDGELLVENVYLSVDPAQRGYVNDENNYVPPVPVGDVMRALAVGRVVQTRHPDVAEGEYLYGWFGWQDYCTCTPQQILRRVIPSQAPLSTAAGLLGINGLTAYMALETIGQPKSGETVLVSAGAGAVGSIVGQLARAAGCTSVAVVGDDDKGRTCIDAYGYEAWINYRTSVADGLARHCAGGVDVFFDNVGGDVADAVRPNMNLGGRIIVCGTVAIPTWVPVPTGPRVERDILTRRLRMEGFVIFDHVARYDAVAEKLATLYADGAIRYSEDIVDGIEHAPQALADVYAGRNRGKKLIRLRAES